MPKSCTFQRWNPFVADPFWGKSDLPQNRLNRFWHEADIDGNGVIDFPEFTESLGIRQSGIWVRRLDNTNIYIYLFIYIYYTYIFM